MVFEIDEIIGEKKTDSTDKPVSSKSPINIKIPKIDSRIYIFVAGLIIGLLVFSLVGKGVTGAAISENKAKATIKDYLDKALTGQDVKYTIDKVEKAGSIYWMDLTFTQGDKTNPGRLGLSADGRYFMPYPDAIIDFKKEASSTTTKEISEPAKAYPKSDKPKLDFFVMSFCPYGVQAEAGIIPVVRLLSSKVDFQPHFVIYDTENYKGEEANYCIGKYCSMHGIDELKENVRQICIFKSNKDKFWSYLEKVNSECKLSDISTCWKKAANALGINVADIESCEINQAESLLKTEYDLCKAKRVSGSPTIMLNGEEYASGRSPENFKTAICSAFNKAPSECEQELSTTGAATTGSC